MILEELRIERVAYGPNKGKFTGKIRFANDRNRIEMTLPDDMSDRLLKVVADSLVDSAKELATELTSECVDALPEPLPRPSILSKFRGE